MVKKRGHLLVLERLLVFYRQKVCLALQGFMVYLTDYIIAWT